MSVERVISDKTKQYSERHDGKNLASALSRDVESRSGGARTAKGLRHSTDRSQTLYRSVADAPQIGFRHSTNWSQTLHRSVSDTPQIGRRHSTDRSQTLHRSVADTPQIGFRHSTKVIPALKQPSEQLVQSRVRAPQASSTNWRPSHS
eukprot:6214293-Pleurochrysis_carterae.AAC.4